MTRDDTGNEPVRMQSAGGQESTRRSRRSTRQPRAGSGEDKSSAPGEGRAAGGERLGMEARRQTYRSG